MSDSTKPFRYYLRVRYAECDGQKVVFNARYADYIELATTEFFRALGFGDLLVNGTLDYQLVKQTISWKGSARFDDILEICVSAAALGNTSFTIAQEFRRAGEADPIATSETVYVMVDAHTLKKSPIPDKVRSALSTGAPGKTTDHAAYGR
jgi:acyl-CoA thioester hydrolase